MVIAIQPPSRIVPLLEELIRLDGSDLYLFPEEPPAFRLRGKIERTDAPPLTAEEVREIAEEAFGAEELGRLGKGDAAIRGVCKLDRPEPGGPIRFLLTAGLSSRTCTLAVRMFPFRIFSPEHLRVPAAVLQACASGRGLIVFSGLVGSGVTTSAAACVEHINATRQAQICVIGDPIEYVFEPKQSLVQHKVVGIDVPDVVSGIAAAMQQDADVLYLSELKHTEDLEAGLRAAQHALVIAIVHALSPEAAIEQMILAFPPDMQNTARKAIANALICVTNQRLLPRADGKGRVAAYGVFTPDRATIREIVEIPNLSAAGFNRGEGDLPPGYAPLARHIEQLRGEGGIAEETANEALAGC